MTAVTVMAIAAKRMRAPAKRYSYRRVRSHSSAQQGKPAVNSHTDQPTDDRSIQPNELEVGPYGSFQFLRHFSGIPIIDGGHHQCAGMRAGGQQALKDLLA